MTTPASCLRCQKPLAIDSASGLCPTCFKSLETERGTPSESNPTASFPPEAETRLWDGKVRPESNDFDVAGATRTFDAKVRQREAPAGYEFIRYLGGGGMGDVYLAREIVADRIVAMKFLRAASDPQSARRFEKEIRALAKLDHPNIIRVLSVDVDRADPFFTMEHATGGSLSDRIKIDGPMSPTEVAKLGVDLMRALAASHGEQILHRDIKPGNILFDAAGTPKLGDFGLAKTLDEQVDTQTVASRAVGTPPFMPPEAVSRKHGEFSPATDVYGLGATLYFTLTGQAPFSGEPHEVMRKVEREEPPRPRSLRPEIPLALEACVLKCLQKKPTDRYGSSADLTADLEKYLAGEAPDAPPMTRIRRVGKWMRRRAVPLAVVAAAIAISVGIWFALPPPVDPVQPPGALEQMQRDLDAGREVVLIPEKGLPRWHEWRVAAPELFQATDGSCAFEAIDVAILILCPDPMRENYRVTAEISQRKTKVADGGPKSGVMQAGLVIGHSSIDGPHGDHADVFVPINFADHPIVSSKAVQLRGELLLQRKGANIEQSQLGFGGSKPYAQTGLPGPYRLMEFEVRSTGVQGFWKDETGTVVRFANVSSKQVKDNYASRKQFLDQKLRPDHGMVIPEWHPRMPIGIWCNLAAIQVKNVRISPL